MTRTHRTLSLAAAAALLLTACGGNNDQNTETAEPPAEPTGEAETAQTQPEDEDDDSSDEPEPFAAAEVTDVAGNAIGTVTAEEADGGVRISAEVQSLTPGFRGLAIHQNGVCEVQSTNDDGELGDYNSAGEVLPGDPPEDPGVVEGEDELAETPEDDAPQEDETEEQGPQDLPPEAPEGGQDPNAAAEPIDVQPAGQLPGGQTGAGGQGEAPPQPQPEGGDEELPRSERAGSLPNLLINQDGTGHLEVISAQLDQQLLVDDGGTAVIIYASPDHHGNVAERYAPYGPDAQSQATGDAGQRAACGVIEAAD